MCCRAAASACFIAAAAQAFGAADASVLLMSTTAGCVGIDLMCATRMVLFEPAWNPVTEKQVRVSSQHNRLPFTSALRVFAGDGTILPTRAKK